MSDKDYIIIESGKAEQPFKYSVGMHGSKFFKETRDNKRLMGIKCPECGTVYIPPRGVCGKCFVEMNEWKIVVLGYKVGQGFLGNISHFYKTATYALLIVVQ